MMGIASSVALAVDVSIAAKWFLRAERDSALDDILDRIRDEGAYVPPFFRGEMQSVLVGAEHANRIDADEGDAALDSLRDLPIILDSPGERFFSGNDVRLARYFDLTPYDAAYLDSPLAHAARDLGVAVLP